MCPFNLAFYKLICKQPGFVCKPNDLSSKKNLPLLFRLNCELIKLRIIFLIMKH